MEPLLFILTAIGLYFGADWILNRIEIARGERLEYRTLYFFVILLTLAAAAFQLIEKFAA